MEERKEFQQQKTPDSIKRSQFYINKDVRKGSMPNAINDRTNIDDYIPSLKKLKKTPQKQPLEEEKKFNTSPKIEDLEDPNQIKNIKKFQ